MTRRASLRLVAIVVVLAASVLAYGSCDDGGRPADDKFLDVWDVWCCVTAAGIEVSTSPGGPGIEGDPVVEYTVVAGDHIERTEYIRASVRPSGVHRALERIGLVSAHPESMPGVTFRLTEERQVCADGSEWVHCVRSSIDWNPPNLPDAAEPDPDQK